MKGPGISARRTASTLARRLRNVARNRRYRQALRRGGPAGELTWVFDPSPPPPPFVELRLPSSVQPDEAAAWCRRQTLAELGAVGIDPDGNVMWRVGPDQRNGTVHPAAWFAAPGGLPDVLPSHLESCLLLAAAEVVDAVVLCEGVAQAPAEPIAGPAATVDPTARPYALYSSDAWRYDAASDTVQPTRDHLLVKSVGAAGVGAIERSTTTFAADRRGPYFSTADLGPILEVAVRDASLLGRKPIPSDRPTVLVTVPFLARGGAEHTLFETMRELSDRCRFAIATLAPHRPELGDRRDEFRTITDRIYCLGDLVHPAAMYGMLVGLVDSLGAEVVYNANSTTLFYDFVPRLKVDRPSIRIIDHLYDHRVGYIDRYSPDLLDNVDVCVAENHRIAEVLTGDRGWPADRTPVIWPCGRSSDAFPPPSERARTRHRIRGEMGIDPGDVVFFTAARMHPQKRPLDLVELARRVRDLEHVQFLVAGGGDLENEMDRAIKGAGARIRRLPFRSDIPELIVAADVGCLVSDFEGLPVFMLECLQAGRPFLGTDVGDMGEVLRRTGAGIVVDRPGDLAALEAGVRQLAEADEWAELARHATDAGSQFDPVNCAAAYHRAFMGRAL